MQPEKRTHISLASTTDPIELRNSLIALSKSSNVSAFDLQKTIEQTYSRKNLRTLIRKDLEEDETLRAALYLCEQTIKLWIDAEHYDSKKESLAKLKEFDISAMLLDFMGVLMQQDFNYFEMTKVVGSLVPLTPFKDDYMEGVKRCCELLVKMAEADLIDIDPAFNSPLGQVSVRVPFGFDGETGVAIERAKFLPPLVCKPKKIKRNNQSGYITQDSHRITKYLQRHNDDICLDVINLMNSTAYSLNLDVLHRTCDEFSVDSDKDMDEATQRMLWERHQENTYKTALELYGVGNKFYFEWFCDYRGREYDRGYELHLQGNSFKKAMIDFHEPREIGGWEAYAEDFDFPMLTIAEEFADATNAEPKLQIDVQQTEVLDSTNEPCEIGETELPWATNEEPTTDTEIFPVF